MPVIFRLARVLDLCDFRVRIALGTDLEEILLPLEPYEARGEEAPTQRLGVVVWKAGWSGIQYPSRYDPEACNLAVFPENLREGESLEPQG